jgi:GT2 family glycosyltransferase
MKKIFFSIIIPLRVENDYLKETKKFLNQQSFKSFELIVVTDKVSNNPSPSFKRNLGVKMAKGEYVCFLDDDSYPQKNWLKNIFQQIKQNPNVDAFCGPCLTPKSDNIYQKASGLFWSSILGSGGAGQYRNTPQKSRFVDDYPTVNLIVKKSAFNKVGGFKSKYWPGEDTIFCLDLIKNNFNIYYHPSIVVFHHRRAILFPHLQQIKRYALHRGFFAKKFPETSFRLGYLLPSLFSIYIFSIPLHQILFPLYAYLIILFFQFIYFIFQTKNIFLSFLTTITIPLTHIFYGCLFTIGFLSNDLKFSSHKINKKTGNYVGG